MKQSRYDKPETVVARIDAHLAAFPSSPVVILSVAEYLALRGGVVQHSPLQGAIAQGVQLFGNMQSLANACGVRRETLVRVGKGSRRPSAALAARIFELTNPTNGR